MGKRYTATFKCTVSIDFEEDDSDDALVLRDQAQEALEVGCGDLQWWDSYCIEIEEVG